MHTTLNDIRYAVRTWLRSPGFTIVALLTLALGIGANTTMFSVVNATLLRPLPFPDPDRLMTIWKGAADDPLNLNITSLPNFRDWRTRSRTFVDMALFDSAGRGYSLTSGGDPEQVSGVRVSASFFSVLGVEPLLGRTFLNAEEEPGRDRVVILGHGLWTRRYGADPAIVGRTISIDGLAYEVVGVMPPAFQFQFWSEIRQLWVPAGWTRGDQERGSNSFVAIGRLKPDVTLDTARAEMDVIGRALAQEHPDANIGQTVRLVPVSEIGIQSLRPALLALLAVVGFVLLIACVNVANLMLARAAVRQREFAIRSALGAARGRLARQLLTESLALALLGGIGGAVIAVWGTTLIAPLLPRNLRLAAFRPVDRISVDLTVLAFTCGASLLSGLLFGVTPALAALRRNLSDPLKESARGSTSGKSRLRYGLVSVEVALTLVVLAGAGVMIASVARLLGVDPGLDPKNVLVMSMSLTQEDLYNGPPGNPRFCEELDRHVSATPGVLSVSAIAHLPLSGGGAGRGLTIEGRPDPGPANQQGSAYSVACPNMLRTLGISRLSGRDFTFTDALGAPPVVIVNEQFAKRFWPGEDAVGKRFKIGLFGSDNPWLTVIGVFRDVRRGSLDEQNGSWFLRPYQQAAWPTMTIITKTATAPATLAAPIKKALAIVEPLRPVTGVGTMEEVVGTSVSSRRFPMMLLSGFALLALVLAAVGIAGVVGFSVVQRTQEIGVRMALGAQSRDVLRLVLGHSLLWTIGGLAVGLLGCVLVLPLLRSLVFGVTATDPLVLGVVSVLLIGVSVAASYLPARRAMRVDPVSALRGE